MILLGVLKARGLGVEAFTIQNSITKFKQEIWDVQLDDSFAMAQKPETEFGALILMTVQEVAPVAARDVPLAEKVDSTDVSSATSARQSSHSWRIERLRAGGGDGSPRLRLDSGAGFTLSVAMLQRHDQWMSEGGSGALQSDRNKVSLADCG